MPERSSLGRISVREFLSLYREIIETKSRVDLALDRVLLLISFRPVTLYCLTGDVNNSLDNS